VRARAAAHRSTNAAHVILGVVDSLEADMKTAAGPDQIRSVREVLDWLIRGQAADE